MTGDSSGPMVTSTRASSLPRWRPENYLGDPDQGLTPRTASYTAPDATPTLHLHATPKRSETSVLSLGHFCSFCCAEHEVPHQNLQLSLTKLISTTTTLYKLGKDPLECAPSPLQLMDLWDKCGVLAMRSPLCGVLCAESFSSQAKAFSCGVLFISYNA